METDNNNIVTPAADDRDSDWEKARVNKTFFLGRRICNGIGKTTLIAPYTNL